MLIATDMTAQIAQEVNRPALPRGTEHRRERRFEPRVRVADGRLHPDQATRDQRPQELAPERLGLRGADVQADDLAPARLVDGVRDHHALARDAPPGRGPFRPWRRRTGRGTDPPTAAP
jgi:hypothetical protein